MKAAIRSGFCQTVIGWNDNQLKPTFEPNSKKHSSKVLLKIHAAAINPIDYKIPKLIAGTPLGSDVSGEIVEVGSNVNTDEFQVGDEVYGSVRLSDKNNGSLSEYCIIDTDQIAKKKSKKEWTMVECAALGIAYVTTLQSLRLGNVTPDSDNSNKAVLVIGASGGCGIAGLQFCRAMGVSRIVAICSKKNAEFVCSAAGMKQGVEGEKDSIQVVDYTNTEEFDTFFKENEGKFDCVFDAASSSGKGEDYWSLSVPLLKKVQKEGDVAGKYVALNGPLDKWIRFKTGIELENQHIIIGKMNTADLELSSVLLDQINVKPIVAHMPFTEEGVKDGFDMLQGRRTKGKIVFDINN